MKGQEMLDLIGNVKGSYIMEAQAYREGEKKRKRRSRVKIVLIAAVIASMLVGCTYAVMRLQDLKIGEYTPDALPTEIQSAEYTAPKARDMISLQGFSGSPSFQATKEWLDFEKAYDPNGELATDADNAGFVPPAEYMAYNCYTQEMMDKVDEICQKYSLKPLGQLWMEQMNMQAMLDLLGIDGITSAQGEHKLLGGYYYEGGTFQVDGTAMLSGWDQPVSYSFRSVMKDALDYVCLVVGQIEDYTQWTYTTRDGIEVLLAFSPEKALILADQETYFATVNVLNFGENWENMDNAALESLADTFCFTYQPHTVAPVAAKARQEAEQAEFMAEQEAMAAQWEEKSWEILQKEEREQYCKPSFAEFIQDSLNHPVRKNAKYAFMDVTEDGENELILQYEAPDIPTGTHTETCIMTMGFDGMTLCLTRTNAVLCENGALELVFESESECTYDYFKLDGTTSDYVTYNYESGWMKYKNGEYIGISESEATEIINSYTPATLDWKPITEFPIN